jgi:hypothetical protein
VAGRRSEGAIEPAMPLGSCSQDRGAEIGITWSHLKGLQHDLKLDFFRLETGVSPESRHRRERILNPKPKSKSSDKELQPEDQASWRVEAPQTRTVHPEEPKQKTKTNGEAGGTAEPEPEAPGASLPQAEIALVHVPRRTV